MPSKRAFAELHSCSSVVWPMDGNMNGMFVNSIRKYLSKNCSLANRVPIKNHNKI